MRKHKVETEPCYCDQHKDYSACCDTFYSFLNDCKVGLKYHKEIRMFSILISRNMGRQGIYNCPWCGSKLPPILDDLRDEILEREFGVENYMDKEQLAKIPASFKTDQWWIERGL